MSSTNSRDIAALRSAVWKHYKSHGRNDLPWRKTREPYQILVSEVMLQQTQVPRVIGKYKEFLKAFPSARKLAQAPLSEVLKVWNGLGYNRRAKHLRDAANIIVEEYGGKVPRDFAALKRLPGVGNYTASAVRAFAFDEPDILIETNIRTAFIHHFFADTSNSADRQKLMRLSRRLTDKEILAVAEDVARRQDPRAWHWALMDYGAYLKKSGVRTNSRSAHYTKQSKFEGSLRQVRGAVLRELRGGSSTLQKLPFEKAKVTSALASLARDELIIKKKGRWKIA